MALVRILLFALLLVGTPVHAKRIAIIIANEAYASEARLANPLKDARAIAAALGPQGARFDEVRLLTNLDQKGLKRAIIGIASTAAGADTLLVYFSGHGIRDPYRRNFLLPVDADISKEEDIPVEGVDAQELLDAVREARPKAGLIVLDACRNNPFQDRLGKKGTNKGLNRMNLDGVKGILVAYAAEGGEQADDGKPGTGSPFASAFARLIATPGTPLLAVLDKVGDEVMAATSGRQSPTRDGNLRADYVLVPGNTVPVVQPVVLRADVERELWDMCKTGTSPGPCQSYLQRYATGTYAWLAKTKVDSLTQVPAAGMPDGDAAAGMRRALAAITPILWSTAATDAIYAPFSANGGTLAGLTALAQAGDPNAMALLGFTYRDGLAGQSRDLAQALRWFRSAAMSGQANAQVEMGRAFELGNYGLSRDEREALRNYRLAANQGNAIAQLNLGVFFRVGRGGVTPDPVEALRWYRASADQGYARGQTGLGYMYDAGLGVAHDKSEALRLYRLAADQGYSLAQRNLAVFYENGLGGLQKDQAQAIVWYRKAAVQGDDGAIAALKRLGVSP